jgi:hypothetical protein
MRVPTSWASAVDPSWCWDWGTNSGYIVPTTTQSVPATRNATTVRPWPAIVRVVPRLLPYILHAAASVPRCCLGSVAGGTGSGGFSPREHRLPRVYYSHRLRRKCTPGNWFWSTGRGTPAWMGPGVESPQGPGYDRRRKQDPDTTRV